MSCARSRGSRQMSSTGPTPVRCISTCTHTPVCIRGALQAFETHHPYCKLFVGLHITTFSSLDTLSMDSFRQAATAWIALSPACRPCTPAAAPHLAVRCLSLPCLRPTAHSWWRHPAHPSQPPRPVPLHLGLPEPAVPAFAQASHQGQAHNHGSAACSEVPPREGTSAQARVHCLQQATHSHHRMRQTEGCSASHPASCSVQYCVHWLWSICRNDALHFL